MVALHAQQQDQLQPIEHVRGPPGSVPSQAQGLAVPKRKARIQVIDLFNTSKNDRYVRVPP